MIIDFHTHAFPDELAKKAIPSLTSNIKRMPLPAHDGTVSGLMKNMDSWGIAISVVLPVITKQSQFISANKWAKSICSERLISFGGVYPHTDDYKRDIDFIAELGLKGIKFHPEYQDFVLDDLHMLKVYDYALSKGLMLIFHSGFDSSFRPPYKSSPMRFLNVLSAMKGGIIIAAHLGGCAQWGDVETFLAGKDIYFDTSMGFDLYSEEQFLRILKKHGADKILFASDSPWSHADTEIEKIKALPVSESDKDAILSGNAKRLLGIN